MKLLSRLGLATRRFPAWLQAFNVLCGGTALVILAFGAWHLASRGRQRVVESVLVVPEGGGAPRPDLAALEARLETAAGGAALGEALASSSDDATVGRVLDAALETCLPGSLTLAATLAGRDDSPSSERARAEVEAVLQRVAQPPLEPARLREGARALVESAPARDATLFLAARLVVQGTPLRRRAAVERLAKLHDGRGVPALLVALGAPPGEEATRTLAEQALSELAAPAAPPPADGTPEDRWLAWWNRTGRRTWLAPPYDLEALARALLPRLDHGTDDERRDALRGLGLARHAGAAPRAGAILATTKDSLTKTTAVWALGRIGGPSVVEPLGLALGDPSPSVRIAAARAVGRARALPLKPGVSKLLDDRDEPTRIAAALALLGFLDRSALPEIDVVAFDEKRSPAERLAVLELLEDTGDGASSCSRWIAALSDPDEAVQRAAREALARRAGRDAVLVGRKAWERWWLERWADTGLRVPAGIRD